MGFRLVLWYSAVFILCMLGLMAGFYFYLSNNLRHKDLWNLSQRTNEMSAAYGSGGLKELKVKAAPFLHSYLIRVVVRGRESIGLNESESWEEVDQKELDVHLQKSQDQWFQVAKREEDEGGVPDYGFEFRSIKLSDGFYLQVGQSTQKRQELLEIYRNVFQLAVIPMILIGMLAGSFLAYSNILNPIRRLTETLQIILKGDLSARVPEEPAQDELGQLTRLFNQMLDRIEKLVKGIRQSTDNVAHDLRTPLTRLKIVAETTLQKKPSASVYHEALADCSEEVDKILSTLNALMDISEA